MKSKYAELFTAKLNDMDLVLFEKHRDWESWTVAKQSDKCFMVSDNFDYFLCLPQHNENGQCLHWLNTGEIQGLICGEWMDLHQEDMDMSLPLSFRCKGNEFRIKPKKEKRWIRINKNDQHVDQMLYKTEEDCKHLSPDKHWYHYEIEVEV